MSIVPAAAGVRGRRGPLTPDPKLGVAGLRPAAAAAVLDDGAAVGKAVCDPSVPESETGRAEAAAKDGR